MPPMSTTQLILVGGFLGAGKTTLLAEAARRLTAQDRRVGLVANDQAAELVDTEILKETGSAVEEVAGGCFCCRFPDMIAAMERLVRQAGADVLIGEPVGSCTDLSATVLQPLKKLHAGQFDVAPFSVLVDVNQVGCWTGCGRPRRPGAVGPFPDNVLYIYDKQLEEADLIVLNKADLISAAELAALKGSLAERFPDAPLLAMSAQSGEGVDAWLDFLSGGKPAGGKIAEVDYDIYAAGEAALGWMNASARWPPGARRIGRRWRVSCWRRYAASLRAQSAQIAHLKMYLTGGGGQSGRQPDRRRRPAFRSAAAWRGQRRGELLINARVHVQPDALREAVERPSRRRRAKGWRRRSPACGVSSPAGRSRPIASASSCRHLRRGQDHGCHCWLVQQCCPAGGSALLDKPAVAPDGRRAGTSVHQGFPAVRSQLFPYCSRAACSLQLQRSLSGKWPPRRGDGLAVSGGDPEGVCSKSEGLPGARTEPAGSGCRRRAPGHFLRRRKR